MPKFLEDKLKKEYPGNDSAVYGTMNKIGAMHGNKETAKGRAMEAKHERDVAAGRAKNVGHDGKPHERPNESPAHEAKETKAQEAYEQRTGREIGTDGKNWIAGAIKHPGALHKQLGVPQGEKIPEKKLEHAASQGGTLGRRARLAETLKKIGHDGKPCATCQRIHDGRH